MLVSHDDGSTEMITVNTLHSSPQSLNMSCSAPLEIETLPNTPELLSPDINYNRISPVTVITEKIQSPEPETPGDKKSQFSTVQIESLPNTPSPEPITDHELINNIVSIQSPCSTSSPPAHSTNNHKSNNFTNNLDRGEHEKQREVFNIPVVIVESPDITLKEELFSESEEISFSDGDNGCTFNIDNNAQTTDIVDVPVILVKSSTNDDTDPEEIIEDSKDESEEWVEDSAGVREEDSCDSRWQQCCDWGQRSETSVQSDSDCKHINSEQTEQPQHIRVHGSEHREGSKNSQTFKSEIYYQTLPPPHTIKLSPRFFLFQYVP